MSSLAHPLRRHLSPRLQRSGFSLLELLVVVAVIAILASLLLPALASAKLKAQGLQCLSHGRQLTLGWLMYADDHDGWLCPNGNTPKTAWVEGVMTFDTNFSDNTNTLYLVDPRYAKLGPYVSSAAVYQCPSDKSMVLVNRRSQRRVRTVAMNDAVGSNAEGSFLPASYGWKVYRKMQDITAPSPSGLWLLAEQHPDSINDGRFVVDCQNRDATARWIDFPANFHNRAGVVSFTDGHAEMHRWVDSRTLQPNLYCGCLSHYAADGYHVSASGSVDLSWLQERTSARRQAGL